MKITSRLPSAGTTIFTTMSALAQEHGAINLSQGFPDFDCDPELVSIACRHLSSNHNQYAPMAGTLALRERVAEILSTEYGASYDPATEITITAGATQAIFTAIAALAGRGDEVIIFEPAYDCYEPAIILQGATPVRCRLNNDFSIPWDKVATLVAPNTRAIIINSPQNPTGTVLQHEDILALERLVENTNIVVISDEVYEHMVFDGQRHESVTRSRALSRRCIYVTSFGKTVHTTGWKIGAVAADKAIMAEFRKVHQFLVFVVNHPLQLALAEFLGNRERYRSVATFYQAKRDLFLDLMRGSRFTPLPCRGTYFQLMSYQSFSEEKDSDLAIRLTKEKKIATIPLSAFYSDRQSAPLLRFCFAKKDETLEKAAEILRAI